MKPDINLDYAPAPPNVWRRHLRLIVMIALLIPTLLIANHYRDDLLTRAGRIYWYRPCANWTIPRNTLLSESDPVRAKALLAGNPDYAPVTYSAGTVAIYDPRCWREYAAVEPRSVALRGRNFHPIVFLHERRSPAGHSRLVVVSAEWANAYDLHRLADHVVLPAPSLFEHLPPNARSTGFAYSGPYLDVTLSPGVADPADPSHFSIDFSFPDRLKPDHSLRQGTLDGHLRDDDTIDFQIRDPATTQNT